MQDGYTFGWVNLSVLQKRTWIHGIDWGSIKEFDGYWVFNIIGFYFSWILGEYFCNVRLCF